MTLIIKYHGNTDKRSVEDMVSRTGHNGKYILVDLDQITWWDKLWNANYRRWCKKT